MKNIKKIYSLLLTIILLASMFSMLVGCVPIKDEMENPVEDDLVKSIFTEDFESKSEEEQVIYIQNELERLEDTGYIKNGTIEYDESQKMFSFEYEDGTLGGISLKKFDDSINTATNASDDKTHTGENVSEKTEALVLNAFENTSYRRDYYEALEKDWENKGLDTVVDVDVTVEDMTNLQNYDVIVFAMHGDLYRKTPALCLNETVTKETDKKYAEYLNDKSIVTVYYGAEASYLILPDFFKSQYNNGEINSDIIFSESCMFYGNDSVSTEPDYTFANALVDVSDGAVIGYHNSVGATYSRDIMKCTVDNALNGKKAAEALELAKKKYGDDDGWEDVEENKYIAYPILTGKKDARVVELYATDFTLPEEMTVTIGELSVIEPTIVPEDATSYSVSWKSSDPTVVAVSPTGEAGIITPLKKGTAVVTAELTSGSKKITKSTTVRVASKARDTVLVLDISGSMYGDPLREMKESAIKFCNDLLKDEYNNRVGIVFYASNTTVINLTSDLDYLIERIENISCNGATNMYAGLEAADNMLENNSKDSAIKNVVIMADGLPNLGKTSYSGSMPATGSQYDSAKTYASAVIDKAQAMMKTYNLYSLGFFHAMGSSEKVFAATLMKELTNKDGYYQVDKAEDLQFAFGDISDEISTGAKIVVNIACPVDVSVSYGNETLSSAADTYCENTSFGTLQLLGKNMDIKVLSLDADKQYKIDIVGTGEGKMDYSVNYFDESEQLIDYRSFESVPITKTTTISTETSNTEKNVELKIDSDSDGEVDTVWSASEKSEGEITYEKTPPTPEPTLEPALEPTVEPTPQMEKTDNDFSTDQILIVALALLIVVLLAGVVGIAIAVGKQSENGFTDVPDSAPVMEKKHIEQITEDNPEKLGMIKVTSGVMNGITISLKDGETVYVGKDPKFANLVITKEYKMVSRAHCSITYDGKNKKYYVVDSSSNGTYLNKTRLTKGKRTPISVNSVIALANDECTLYLG